MLGSFPSVCWIMRRNWKDSKIDKFCTELRWTVRVLCYTCRIKANAGNVYNQSCFRKQTDFSLKLFFLLKAVSEWKRTLFWFSVPLKPAVVNEGNESGSKGSISEMITFFIFIDGLCLLYQNTEYGATSDFLMPNFAVKHNIKIIC